MATMGTEESDQCRQVTVVERLKQEWMHGLSAKKNGGRCREVAVSGGSNNCIMNILLMPSSFFVCTHAFRRLTKIKPLVGYFTPNTQVQRTKGLITANFVINSFWISLSFSALIQIICLFVIMSHLICPFIGGASSTSVATLQDRNTSPLFSQRRRFTKSLNKIRSTHLLKRVQAMQDMGLPAVRGRQLLRPVYR